MNEHIVERAFGLPLLDDNMFSNKEDASLYSRIYAVTQFAWVFEDALCYGFFKKLGNKLLLGSPLTPKELDLFVRKEALISKQHLPQGKKYE